MTRGVNTGSLWQHVTRIKTGKCCVCFTGQGWVSPALDFKECHKALGGLQSHVTEGILLSPLPESYWLSPHSLNCPCFCYRGQVFFQNPLIPRHAWAVGLAGSPCFLLPAPIWGASVETLPVPRLPELQQRVSFRTYSQNALCLFHHHHLLLGRATLKKAKKKRMRKPNNFYSFHQPLKKERKTEAASGKLLCDHAWGCYRE